LVITSSSNPTVKQIRKLRERKERQQTGLFYAEGLRIIIEAFQSGSKIERLIYSPELLVSSLGRELIEQHRNQEVELVEVSADVFQSFALKDEPQGIGAVIAQRWLPLEQVQVLPGEGWVALDSVADPGNLGTILRTNDAVGGKGVILLDQSTDPYDPTAIRASMGAIFSQQLVKASFVQFAAWKTAGKVPVVGTSGAAQVDYHTAAYPQNWVLLMGSERLGLQDQALRICDLVVRIPMKGSSDSLNLAAATAVVLYEIFNHHRDIQQEKKS
jgi:TrmH family RNA methyltransferase